MGPGPAADHAAESGVFAQHPGHGFTAATRFHAASMDRDFLIDLFSDFGPVTIRPMFSGFGISADGTNFAMALRAGLYFRADEQSIPQFEAEGSKPFQYQTRDKTITVGSYWQLPARLFDDPEQLAGWARAALAAAQRAALRKRTKKRKAVKKAAAKNKPGATKKTSARVVPAKRASRARAGTHNHRR
jgi:DNA transformation protein